MSGAAARDGVLVTGGAGYIGAHMVKLLLARGREVVVLDDLSSGHRDAVPAGAALIEGRAGDTARVADLLAERRIGTVLHFAASIEVAESVADPAKYHANNVLQSAALLEAMREAGVQRIVFSSTAAVYGEPRYTPLDEAHPLAPLNPYGQSKLAVERMLDEACGAHGMCAVSLRYFNAAGADPDGTLGERHEPESHLIPLVLQAASGRRDAVSIFGGDYPTADGTCVRDYVHVADLCEAHLLALKWLESGGKRETFNLGSGRGASVREVIETAQRETGAVFGVRHEPRRPGDAAVLVASARRAEEQLGWRRRRSDLATILRDAWRWERRQAARAQRASSISTIDTERGGSDTRTSPRSSTSS